MYTLVKTDEVPFDDEKKPTVVDPVMPESEVTEQQNPRVRPPTPDDPPPPVEPPEPLPKVIQDPVIDDTDGGITKLPPNDGGKVSLLPPDSEMPIPLVKIAPEYPPGALAKGIEGYCTVEYTVTKTGATKDVSPVDCQPKGVFDSASIKAAAKFKYSPKVVNGEPVEVGGVQNRFVFELEK
ncbi:MAG: energy transducer TonB [Gammaproteobacteria bacterium]|nr:MAG: energy transducer TonB [Gammaproteobacteria bacterium]